MAKSSVYSPALVGISSCIEVVGIQHSLEDNVENKTKASRPLTWNLEATFKYIVTESIDEANFPYFIYYCVVPVNFVSEPTEKRVFWLV